MKNIVLFFLCFLLIQSSKAFAKELLSCESIFLTDASILEKPIFNFLENNYEVAHNYEVLNRFGNTNSNAFARKPIRITVWNTFKWQKENIARDFNNLSKISDLFLTQEAVLNNQSKTIFESDTNKQWWLANSFFNANETPTGVASGSSVMPQEVRFIRSEAREPITLTPKMTLISKYEIDGSTEPLLVINVHMINFVLDKDFESMLQQIDDEIKNHTGPIIFAGDFNTWSPSRMFTLNAFSARHGMIHATPIDDHRLIELDHMYVRGFKINRAEVLDRIESSDHDPLYFEIELLK